MRYDHWLDKLFNGCLPGILAGLILIAFVLSFLLSAGCASTCPPPKVEVVEVKVPVYSCPEPPEEVSSLQLPDYPVPPPDNVQPEGQKSWYAEMVAVVKARHQILLDRIEYLEEILEEYRQQ
jgi:hypothetical protein